MFPVKPRDDDRHDPSLGGPWPKFRLDRMPPRHQRIGPLPMTVFRSPLPCRVETDKRGNPIPIYRGVPKWQAKAEQKVRDREKAKRASARFSERILRGGTSRDVMAKLTAPHGGQGSEGVRL